MHLPGRSQSSQVSAPLNVRNILIQLLRTCCSLSVTQRYTLILLCYGHSEHVTHKYFIWNTLCPTVCYVFQGFRLCCPAIVWVILGVSTRWGGHGGVLNTATTEKNLTNTASPQVKSTKHRHRKSATRIFSAMIRSSTLKIILLYLNNFPQNKHITTLFIAHTSFLRRNLARRKRTKEKRRGLSFTPDPSLLLLSSLFLV